MSYKDELFIVHSDHLEDKTVKRNNRYKKFEYGYNKDLDCVIISRDGTIGKIYEVQGLRIGLPETPKQVWGADHKIEDQYFVRVPKPATLAKYQQCGISQRFTWIHETNSATAQLSKDLGFYHNQTIATSLSAVSHAE